MALLHIFGSTNIRTIFGKAKLPKSYRLLKIEVLIVNENMLLTSSFMKRIQFQLSSMLSYIIRLNGSTLNLNPGNLWKKLEISFSLEIRFACLRNSIKSNNFAVN